MPWHTERGSAMVFVNTENRPGWEQEARSLKRMLHSMCIESRFILNPVARVRNVYFFLFCKYFITKNHLSEADWIKKLTCKCDEGIHENSINKISYFINYFFQQVQIFSPP